MGRLLCRGVYRGGQQQAAAGHARQVLPERVTHSATVKITRPGARMVIGDLHGVGLGRGKHRAPVGLRRLHAEAQVGEGADADQELPEPERGLSQQRRGEVGQDVPPDDERRACSPPRGPPR